MRTVGWSLVVMGALGVVACGCFGARPAEEKLPKLCIAEGGKTEFTIVVADDTSPATEKGAEGSQQFVKEVTGVELPAISFAAASPSTKYGAEELQRFLKEMTGAELPIVSDTTPMGAHEIILGDNAHFKQLGITVDFKALGDEGYVIRTVGPHVVIAGGALRGNMYGVYGLLEDHLGCRWFTPEVSRIPKQPRLLLDPLDDTQIPALEYREPFTIDCFDGDWCARNRMNSSAARLEEKHGGKVRFGGGMFVHTFNRLIPPDQYFAEHPEYFSLIGGERKKDQSQLCCMNEDVIRLCTEHTLDAIRSDPTAFVFSVSQNDWGNYCQCEKCQALAEAEDSQMAPVLYLVNRVAEAVEKEFPDKAIETLAYQWTRKPPKAMRPRSNVIIRLCSIECCFMHPLATCDSQPNVAFCRDAEGWAKVADRLWVWDYVTSFRHYMCPFPNLFLRNDNIQFFIKNHVTGIFEQDNYQSLNGELSALGGYITAKFLWNPGYCEDQAIDEFLEDVFGAAAKPIAKYIDMLHAQVRDNQCHTNIWIGPVEAKYLNDKLLDKAGRQWDRAERAVADQPDVLERVKFARLSVEYARIERARADELNKRMVKGKAFRIADDPAWVARMKDFFEVARRANVTRMDEGSVSLDQYAEHFKEILASPAS